MFLDLFETIWLKCFARLPTVQWMTEVNDKCHCMTHTILLSRSLVHCSTEHVFLLTNSQGFRNKSHVTWIMRFDCRHLPAFRSTTDIGPSDFFPSRQDKGHFGDDIFKWIFYNEYCCILIEIPLKNRRQAIIGNSDGLVCWRIYESLRINELIQFPDIRAWISDYIPLICLGCNLLSPL